MFVPDKPVSIPKELDFPVLDVSVTIWFGLVATSPALSPHLSVVDSPSPVEVIARPQVYSAPKDTLGAKNHSTPIKSMARQQATT